MVEFSSLTLIDKVADFLQANTSIGTVGTDIFAGFMPSAPDRCTAVYAQPGIVVAGDPIVRPGVQILTRNETYSAVHQTAEVIFKTLRNAWNISSSTPGRFYPSHEVGPNYRDANNSIIFTLNFSFTGTRIV